MGCDAADPNCSVGFRYRVLQEKEEHQASEFPHADLLQLCRGVLGKPFPAFPVLCRMSGSFVQVTVHPWFWLGWCWYMIIAQEYSSLSWFISLILDTRNESFSPPQLDDLLSYLIQ